MGGSSSLSISQKQTWPANSNPSESSSWDHEDQRHNHRSQRHCNFHSLPTHHSKVSNFTQWTSKEYDDPYNLEARYEPDNQQRNNTTVRDITHIPKGFRWEDDTHVYEKSHHHHHDRQNDLDTPNSRQEPNNNGRDDTPERPEQRNEYRDENNRTRADSDGEDENDRDDTGERHWSDRRHGDIRSPPPERLRSRPERTPRPSNARLYPDQRPATAAFDDEDDEENDPSLKHPRAKQRERRRLASIQTTQLF